MFWSIFLIPTTLNLRGSLQTVLLIQNFYGTLVLDLSYTPVEYLAKLEECLIATERSFQVFGTPQVRAKGLHFACGLFSVQFSSEYA